MTPQQTYDQAIGLLRAGDMAGAEKLFAEVAAVAPGNFAAPYMLGIARLQQGNALGALEAFDRALALTPGNAEALQSRGAALQALNRFAEALESYDRALAAHPDHAPTWLGRGLLLKRLNRIGEAVRSYDHAVKAKPDFFEAYFHRGIALDELGHREQAVASYDQALKLHPDELAAVNNRAATLMKLKRFAEAAEGYKRLEALVPGHPLALNGLANAATQACDWSNRDAVLARLRAEVAAGRAEIQPGTLLAYHDDPALQMECARNFFKSLNLPVTPPLWKRAFAAKKIRIAYCSADFQSHPVPRLLVRMFENHDRDRFEVHAISFAPDDKSAMRARLEKAFDHFHDVLTRSEDDTARLMAELEVDIAVDLMGYTSRARTGIFTRRPAPVQVNYMGYASTVAADFCDYIIGDPVITPMAYQPFYSERIVQLPDTYMATDDRRAVAGPAPSREEAGLPESGFVFCCFNNNWKIMAPQFDIWMRLMRAMDGSVLWLLKDNDEVTFNLRRHAQERGVDPARLVFAPRVQQPEHMARHRLADLFLDTLPYNAHTTAEDCLWVGAPLITCLGHNFYGRVAASTLHAMGVPELVTENPAEYEALALSLARDPGRLAALRHRIEAARMTAPLFDSARFTRNMEKAYRAMRDNFLAGQGPRPITVT